MAGWVMAGAYRVKELEVRLNRNSRNSHKPPSRDRLAQLQRSSNMLAKLIDEAMEQAVYGIIEDEGTFWGEIPGWQGVWARHPTLEGCRRELREALSDWIALRLRLGLPIPVVAGLDLNQILQPA